MNGGRLSNDETFYLGLSELKRQMAAPTPDEEVADRALARIAIRYPEEAEQLRECWGERQLEHLQRLLAAVEAQHAQESQDSDVD